VNETFRQYWSKAIQYWQRINKTQRIVLISIVAFALIALILIIYNLSRTEYSLAYTDLSPTDAAAIKQYLESNGIPYRFGADGTSIGVPSKLVTAVKIDVAAQNLIQDGSQGFGIFRENLSGFGMTDNEFNILSVDARAGELQKLISAYEGVQRAQVLLTIPEESVFLNADPEEASASVVVTFRPGFRPKQEMIDGIYNLIKTGVPNLPLANITVTDQNGTLLAPSELSDGLAGASSKIEQQLQIKKMVEADIQKSIKSYLSTIYGKDRVVVSVIATLNFDQINAQSRTYTPVNEERGTGIVRSEQIEERSSSSESGTAPGGVAGTGATDVPTYPTSSGGTGSSETEESIITRNYEINEMTRSIVSSPYVVRDLTIFAGIEPPDPNDPNSLSQEELAEIRRILSNVVATSLANNSDRTFTQDEIESRVSVIAQSFRGLEQQTAAETDTVWYYAIGGIGLALAAAAGTALVLYRRRQRRLAEMQALEELEQETAPPEIPSIDLDQTGSEHQIRRQLESLAKRKPEEFVNLLRTWLVDD
jgi:flagellar M-ring protein FliF